MEPGLYLCRIALNCRSLTNAINYFVLSPFSSEYAGNFHVACNVPRTLNAKTAFSTKVTRSGKRSRRRPENNSVKLMQIFLQNSLNEMLCFTIHALSMVRLQSPVYWKAGTGKLLDGTRTVMSSSSWRWISSGCWQSTSWVRTRHKENEGFVPQPVGF